MASSISRRTTSWPISAEALTHGNARRTIVLVKIVSDTNTFLAVALGEPERPLIIRATQGHELLAPEILPFEIGNALTALMKKRALDPEEIPSVWEAAQRIPVALQSIDIPRALKLASHFNIYAYDAYFLECALATRSPLLTLDRRLKAVAKEAGVEALE